ncbi:MAG: RNA polymerase sigma factor [Gemmataceae bacterium]
MSPDSDNDHLSHMSTVWSMVRQAHDGSMEENQAARRQLIERYYKPIHRYFLAAVGVPETAEELGQEFVLRFLRGTLKGANPDRGRFRDYVKGVLSHHIADHYRKKGSKKNSVQGAFPEPAIEDKVATDLDGQFLENWRRELLDRAWKELAAIQRKSGAPFFDVLRFRIDHSSLRSQEIAEKLTVQFGKPVNAAWVRQTLRRARDKFVQCLIAEVVQTLDAPTLESLESELLELSLFDYCKETIKTYRFPK